MGLLKRLIVVKNFVMVPVLMLVVFENGEVSSEKVAVAPLGLATLGLIKQVLPLTKTWSVMMVHFVMVQMNLHTPVRTPNLKNAFKQGRTPSSGSSYVE